jgi:diguanylate cyclase (GGDEF)-like protein
LLEGLNNKKIKPKGSHNNIPWWGILTAVIALYCLAVIFKEHNFKWQMLLFLVPILLLSEYFSIELTQFGRINFSICIYYILILLTTPAFSTLMALIGGIAKEWFNTRAAIEQNLKKIGQQVFIIFLCSVVYDTLNMHKPLELNFINIFALIVSAIVYLGLYHLFTKGNLKYLDKDFQLQWRKTYTRLHFLNILLIGTGVLLAFLMLQSYWYSLFLLALLWFSRQALLSELSPASSQKDLEMLLVKTQTELLEAKAQNQQLQDEINHKFDELLIFYEVGQALGASLNLNTTLEIILAMLRKLIVYQSGVIFLLEGDNIITAKAATPFNEVLELSPLLNLEEKSVIQAIRTKAPVLHNNVPEEEKRIFKNERSVMCVPLVVQNEIIGVIYVGSERQDMYKEHHLHLLSILANAGAIAIRASKLYESQKIDLLNQQKVNQQLDNTIKQLSYWFDMGQALARSINIEDTLNIIMEKTTHMVPCQSFIIFFIHPVDNHIYAKKFDTPYQDFIKGYIATSEEESLVWVAKQKKPLLIEDSRTSRLTVPLENERSILMVPLLAEDKVSGVLYVGDPEPQRYNHETLNLLEGVSFQAAMAIKNAELYERTAQLAITDGVTGLYTHRYFQERLGEEILKAQKENKVFSLLMLDTDKFKQFNDTLGHPEGDKLLKEIATLLKSYAKDHDVVCRYGGDEFTLILKDLSKEGAVRVAENIREAFQLRLGHHKVKVSASIGVASFPEDGLTKLEIMAAADSALYKAKETGRNKVCAAGEMVINSSGGTLL